MTHTAAFRFYEELNDFLPEKKKKTSFDYIFNGNSSVKDAVEALGVPHVEIDLILVNGVSVDFSYRLRDNDNVSVYPVFETFDIKDVTHLRHEPLRDIRFIADVHLGKLARYLRLCGFDTHYDSACSDNEIIAIAKNEGRIILTRDKGILRNGLVAHGRWIRSQDPAGQLGEVIARFDLKRKITLFSRCSICNCILSTVPKTDIEDRLLPATALFYDEFKICTGCKKIYWQGSHSDRLTELIGKIVSVIC